MGNRYRDEIIASILDSATKEEEGVRMTKAMYASFLSDTSSNLLRYLGPSYLYRKLNSKYGTWCK